MLKINQLGFPQGPFNSLVYFVAYNPITTFNPVAKFPKIHSTAFIGPFSSVIGDVTIGPEVFIAPNVSIRADEGAPFHIGSRTNLQDGVYISPGAIVTGGVHIPAKRFVPPQALIDSQEKADKLRELPLDREEFAHEVQRINVEFASSYSLLFGSKRCSCGLSCDIP